MLIWTSCLSFVRLLETDPLGWQVEFGVNEDPTDYWDEDREDDDEGGDYSDCYDDDYCEDRSYFKEPVLSLFSVF